MTVNAERCPICGSSTLVRYGSRPEGSCPDCRAKERTRTMYLILRKLDLLRPGFSVLHIAPEKPLADKLISIFGEEYTLCDMRPEALEGFPDTATTIVSDLTNIDPTLNDMQFDVVIHSHVMEHVRASWPLVFLRLHDLLKPDGWHMFAVPLMREWSKEDLADMTDEQRKRAFGQHDHVRYIGRKDFFTDMHNIVALTGCERLTAATDVLDESEMAAIAGDPDVFLLQRRPYG